MNCIFIFAVFFVGAYTAKSCTLDSWEQLILDKHNEWRASSLLDPLPANMLRVRWDTNIAQNAQDHIDNCNWAHSSNAFRTGVGGYVNPWYSSSTGLGENMAAYYGTTQMSNYGKGWFDERVDYDWDTNSGSGVVGHYTALISYNVFAIGCAHRTCTSGSPFGSGSWNFYVCQYGDYPQGNFNNWKPYDQGSGGLNDAPSSVDPPTHPGLCTGSTPTCSPECETNADCVGTTCQCKQYWTGLPSCTTPLCSPTCTTNADCTTGTPPTCECKQYWTGAPGCTTPLCTPGCTTNANCVAGNPPTCECKNGWTNAPACNTAVCDPACGTNAECVGATCQCKQYWSGLPDCTTPVCSPSCSANADCFAGSPPTCQCKSGWANPPNCDVSVTCSPSCSTNAICTGSPAECVCSSYWTGLPDCTTPLCATTCAENAHCVAGVPPVCECDDGWTNAPLCDSQDDDDSVSEGGGSSLGTTVGIGAGVGVAIGACIVLLLFIAAVLIIVVVWRKRMNGNEKYALDESSESSESDAEMFDRDIDPKPLRSRPKPQHHQAYAKPLPKFGSNSRGGRGGRGGGGGYGRLNQDEEPSYGKKQRNFSRPGPPPAPGKPKFGARSNFAVNGRPGKPSPPPGKSRFQQRSAGNGRFGKARPPAPPMKRAKPKPRGNFAKVTDNYQSQRNDELSIRVGDRVKIIREDDDGWMFGSLRGKTGMFPGNYVEKEY